VTDIVSASGLTASWLLCNVRRRQHSDLPDYYIMTSVTRYRKAVTRVCGCMEGDAAVACEDQHEHARIPTLPLKSITAVAIMSTLPIKCINYSASLTRGFIAIIYLVDYKADMA
jgi:hypothetical protein